MNKARYWLLLLVTTTLVLSLDQLSKMLVIDRLVLGESWAPIPALADFFKITHSANSGAAFSIFQGANLPLLVLAIVMSIGILVYFARLIGSQWLQRVALGILLGGVLGNALDRMRFGIVIDFIHWQIPHVISNVSNLADHAIVLSVILLLIAQREPRSKSEPSTVES